MRCFFQFVLCQRSLFADKYTKSADNDRETTDNTTKTTDNDQKSSDNLTKTTDNY